MISLINNTPFPQPNASPHPVDPSYPPHIAGSHDSENETLSARQPFQN